MALRLTACLAILCALATPAHANQLSRFQTICLSQSGDFQAIERAFLAAGLQKFSSEDMRSLKNARQYERLQIFAQQDFQGVVVAGGLVGIVRGENDRRLRCIVDMKRGADAFQDRLAPPSWGTRTLIENKRVWVGGSLAPPYRFISATETSTGMVRLEANGTLR